VNGGPEVGMGIRGLAKSLDECKRVVELGCDGIGVFAIGQLLDGDRKGLVRRFLLENTGREELAAELTTVLARDLGEVFKTAGPVAVRVLDSIGEFLPDLAELAGALQTLRVKKELGQTVSDEELKEKEGILKKVRELTESNPDLGIRGSRMAFVLPELWEVQLKAILEGACIAAEKGANPQAEVLIPMPCSEKEIASIRSKYDEMKDAILKQRGATIAIRFGAMIETPRAALIADRLAVHCDFLVIGTDGLSELGLAFDADNSNAFGNGAELRLLIASPFSSIDLQGIGRLMEMSVKKAREGKSGVEIGVAGRQEGDDQSIKFCHSIGASWICCPMQEVPTARIAAAQAVIQDKV
jgi:pyruvate,orthophosphate dikinase